MPDLMTNDLLEPLIALAPPACAAPDCPHGAVVQWRRRDGDDPDGTVPVHACANHAIRLDAAALVHRPTCPAPDPAQLPACGCSPEAPVPDPVAQPVTTLPTGWVIPTP